VGKSNELERFRALSETLYSAVIGDILDQMGRYHQFLPPYLRPIDAAMVLVGRAMPVLESDVCGGHFSGTGHNRVLSRPFGLMLDALDDLRPGEVYLCAGASPSYALWGELMATRALKLGASGAILDGYHRDTEGILAKGFPVFSRGSYAQDQAPRGAVVDYRIPLEIGNVRVSPGDLVFGDFDGVVVIPQDIELEVLEQAEQKAATENRVGRAINDGMSARAAFDTFGVL